MNRRPTDLFVVVRSANERTQEECLRIVGTQVRPSDIALLNERPFARALEAGIEIAIKEGRQWSVFLDADVLLRSDALAIMRREMAAETAPFYMLNFLLLDRGFAGPAFGAHAYRTESLRRAREFIPAASGDQRPETRLCKEMAGAGVPTIRSRTVVGLHDYEQFHADLYRKMFVRAAKFRTQLDYMLSVLRRNQNVHADFRSMLWGLVDGLASVVRDGGSASLDARAYVEKAIRALEEAGIAEKPALRDTIDVDAVLAAFQPSEQYTANAAWIAPGDRTAFSGHTRGGSGGIRRRVSKLLHWRGRR